MPVRPLLDRAFARRETPRVPRRLDGSWSQGRCPLEDGGQRRFRSSSKLDRTWACLTARRGRRRSAHTGRRREMDRCRRIDRGCPRGVGPERASARIACAINARRIDRQVRRRTVVVWSVQRLLHAVASEFATGTRRLPCCTRGTCQAGRCKMISDPIGIFRARSTKDGEAFERDGQSYFAINPLRSGQSPPGIVTCSRSSSATASGCSHGSMTWCRLSRRPTRLDARTAVSSAPVGSGSWAATPGVRRSMQGNRRKDTRPELAVRRLLHAAGLRYRVDARPIPTSTGARTSCSPARGSPCSSTGASGTDARSTTRWRDPMRGTGLRRSVGIENGIVIPIRYFESNAWTVLRAWEHEPADEIARRVIDAGQRRTRRCASAGVAEGVEPMSETILVGLLGGPSRHPQRPPVHLLQSILQHRAIDLREHVLVDVHDVVG